MVCLLYLHTTLRKAKSLLNHSGQLPDSTALLSKHILSPTDSLKQLGFYTSERQ